MSVIDLGCRVGGSELLLIFLERAAQLAAERVDVLAPYVDNEAFVEPSVHRLWRRLATGAPITIVVRTPESAQAAWRSLPQATHQFRVILNRRVHAKLFMARGARGWIALAGSMNFTRAALTTNEEIGVLFSGAEPESVLRCLGSSFDAIARNGLPTSPDRGAERRSLRDFRRRQAAPKHATAGINSNSRPWHR